MEKISESKSAIIYYQNVQALTKIMTEYYDSDLSHQRNLSKKIEPKKRMKWKFYH